MPEHSPGTRDSDADAGSDVFVSYASQDAAVANSIVEVLEKHSLGCWIAPRDVVPGSLYADGIVRAITGAKVFVLILSGRAVASQHVSREIERAASKRRPIVALRIDSAPLTPAFEYFLSEPQWIEVSSVGIQVAAEKLVEAVRRHIGSPGGNATLAQLTAPPDRQPAVASRAKWVIAAGVGVLSLAFAYLVVDKFWLPRYRAAAHPPTSAVLGVTDKSIAVLPFTDMSERKDQEYFADGMAEEILDLLAKIPGLTVIGRTSSFQFKGKNEDLRMIGIKLGATLVVEGSVRRVRDRVRVTAQLIDTRSGAHWWSESYDRPTSDELTMQEDIATGIARALQVTVGADRQQSRRRPKNEDAYDLYLRGRHASERADIDGYASGVTYLRQALDIDPNFADAAATLALTYYSQATSSIVPARIGYEQTRRAAESALKLDSTLGLAHAILGAVHNDYDRDWAAADREFKQAIALAPHDGIVLMLSALLPVSLGDLDAARRIYKQSLDYDPLSPDTYWFLAYLELRAGHWVEAESAARKTLEIAPAYDSGRATVGYALLLRGEREAALAEMQREKDPLVRMQGLALVYHALGRKTDSDAALHGLVAQGADLEAYEIASVYGYRTERDEAFKWLDRAYEQREPTLYFLKGDPFLRSLEDDSRYKAFLHKLKLPE